MKMDIIIIEDLQQFNKDSLEEIKGIVGQKKESQNKQWLRSSEVRKVLNISPGILQNLCVNGTLPFRKIGGSTFYSKSEIDQIMEGDRMQN